MSDKYIARRFQNSDSNEVSELIIKTLRTTNIKDYSEGYIENDVKVFTPEGVIERSIARIPIYQTLDTIIIDTNAQDVAVIANEIKRL